MNTTYQLGHRETLKFTTAELGLEDPGFDAIEIDLALVGSATAASWGGRYQMAQHLERRRLVELRSQHTAEEWPEIHAPKFVTPDGVPEVARCSRRVFEDSVVALRLRLGGQLVHTATGGSDAFGVADRIGLWVGLANAVQAANELRPTKRSSPASSDATTGSGVSTESSNDSTTSEP